jgi:hypothetical protein
MNKTLIVGGLLLALLVPSAFAGSQRIQASVLCVELRGNAETRFDVKCPPGSRCARGEDRVVVLSRGLRGPRGLRRPAGARGGPCPSAGIRRAARSRRATGASGPRRPYRPNRPTPTCGVRLIRHRIDALSPTLAELA